MASASGFGLCWSGLASLLSSCRCFPGFAGRDLVGFSRPFPLALASNLGSAGQVWHPLPVAVAASPALPVGVWSVSPDLSLGFGLLWTFRHQPPVPGSAGSPASLPCGFPPTGSTGLSRFRPCPTSDVVKAHDFGHSFVLTSIGCSSCSRHLFIPSISFRNCSNYKQYFSQHHPFFTTGTGDEDAL